MKCRRRYGCPECQHRGRSNNKNRTEKVFVCPLCKCKLELEIQTEDGTGYREFNEKADKMEYEI